MIRGGGYLALLWLAAACRGLAWAPLAIGAGFARAGEWLEDQAERQIRSGGRS